MKQLLLGLTILLGFIVVQTAELSQLCMDDSVQTSCHADMASDHSAEHTTGHCHHSCFHLLILPFMTIQSEEIGAKVIQKFVSTNSMPAAYHSSLIRPPIA